MWKQRRVLCFFLFAEDNSLLCVGLVFCIFLLCVFCLSTFDTVIYIVLKTVRWLEIVVLGLEFWKVIYVLAFYLKMEIFDDKITLILQNLDKRHSKTMSYMDNMLRSCNN